MLPQIFHVDLPEALVETVKRCNNNAEGRERASNGPLHRDASDRGRNSRPAFLHDGKDRQHGQDRPRVILKTENLWTTNRLKTREGRFRTGIDRPGTIHSGRSLSFEEHETADYIAARPKRESCSAGSPERVSWRASKGTATCNAAWCSGPTRTRCRSGRKPDSNAPPARRSDARLRAATPPACSALLVLNRHKSEIAGTVFRLFQPGEEVAPGGASMVMAEDPFRDYRVVAFVGEHVAPEMAVETSGFRSGKYMASSDELWIEVHGTGGHGALPPR